MTVKAIHNLLTYSIAATWILNGLFCKVLNLVSRHQQIVSKILQTEHSRSFTIAIGIAEICMAIWILSQIKSRLNAIAQILIIATMNTMEFILVPGLLLWGKANSIFAFLLILVIFFNEFYLNKRLAQQA
jgi:hypothetical protein